MKKFLFIGWLCLSVGMRAMEKNVPADAFAAQGSGDQLEETVAPSNELLKELCQLTAEVRHVAEAQEEATTLKMLLFLNLKDIKDKNGASGQGVAEKLFGAMLAKRGLEISTTFHPTELEKHSRDRHVK